MRMNRLEGALDQIAAARRYTISLLDGIEPGDWFWMPDGNVTHLAWQVGHLAIAEYRLALVQVRGPRDDDARFFPPDYLRLFGRGSIPASDPAQYPPPEDIRQTLDRVHEQALAEARDYRDADLDLPMHFQHRICKTRYEALIWCSQHEFLHAGQIGLLRRLRGAAPVW